MNMWFYVQLALYEFFDVIPFVTLAAAPFRVRIRSKNLILLFMAVLYILGFARRGVSLAFPSVSVPLSLLWAVLYLSVYYYVIREPVSKLLFVLITVLNYASFSAILYNYMGYRLFFEEIQENPYCFFVSLSIMAILAVTYLPVYCWLTHKVGPLIVSKENENLWTSLWLVPATFCVFFYYNLYTSESILVFSSSTHNLIFSLVITAGSVFVLSLVVRLVKMSQLNSQLLSEKHQMELHQLQYQRLSDRIEEARRARHDLRQWITVLQVYLKNGDLQNLRSYMEEVCSSFSIGAPVSYCRHPHLNALICYYAELASKLKILFQAQVEYPEDATIQDTDLVVLFGNMLENASEACKQQISEDRFIKLNVEKIGGQIIIVMDNSFEKIPPQTSRGFYSSKRPGYGIGIASIKQIAAKYRGTADFNEDGKVFYTSVILNPTEDSF